MLKEAAKHEKLSEDELKIYLNKQKENLNANQMKIKDANLPVMVIIEGWGSSGKGSLIARVIDEIDPRFFDVATMDSEPTEEEKKTLPLEIFQRNSQGGQI